MKKYLSKFFQNNYKFLFKTLNLSDKSKFKIYSINLKIENNTALGKKNENLILPLDEIITPRVFKNENWDYFIIKFIKKNINHKNNFFFDIGANIGLISRQLQNLKLDIKKYFCFEPESNNFNILKQNLKKNSTYFFNYGLSSKNEKRKMFVNTLNKSDNSIFLKNYPNTRNNISKIILKNSNKTLGKIINDNKIKNIIYKSDTQGMDEEIFLNLNDKILDKINLLIIEVSNFKYIRKNYYKFFNKIKKFNFIYNEKGKKISLKNLIKLIEKKKEFNLMAKK